MCLPVYAGVCVRVCVSSVFACCSGCLSFAMAKLNLVFIVTFAIKTPAREEGGRQHTL